MCEFNREDVLILAKAILEEPLVYIEGDREPYFYCQYCDSELRGCGISREEFKHSINCPCLVAQDILTRNK